MADSEQEHPLTQRFTQLDQAKQDEEEATKRRLREDLEFLETTGVVEEFILAAEIVKRSQINPAKDVVVTVVEPESQVSQFAPMDIMLFWSAPEEKGENKQLVYGRVKIIGGRKLELYGKELTGKEVPTPDQDRQAFRTTLTDCIMSSGTSSAEWCQRPTGGGTRRVIYGGKQE